MEIRNCKNCGKIYNYYGGKLICPSCQKKLEEQFLIVKQYIYNNENTTVEEVSKELGVSIKQIHNWVREERLSFQAESLCGIACERCGVLIKTGRFCSRCKAELCQSFSHDIKNEKDKYEDDLISQKMRFLGKK